MFFRGVGVNERGAAGAAKVFVVVAFARGTAGVVCIFVLRALWRGRCGFWGPVVVGALVWLDVAPVPF